jgi:hypothetical protein
MDHLCPQWTAIISGNLPNAPLSSPKRLDKHLDEATSTSLKRRAVFIQPPLPEFLHLLELCRRLREIISRVRYPAAKPIASKTLTANATATAVTSIPQPQYGETGAIRMLPRGQASGR